MNVYLVNIVDLTKNSEQVDSIYTGDDEGYRWANERAAELEVELTGNFSVEVQSMPITNETYA